MSGGTRILLAAALLTAAGERGYAQATAKFRSHPPTRPLPSPSNAKNSPPKGPALVVDAQRGDDASAGTEQAPWKSLTHSLARLKPGDTLFLRGGVYYEKTFLTRSGTAEAPITIRGYPGELAIVDGGLREFFETPQTAWEPSPEGVAGEFVSTRTYRNVDARRVPHHFLPATWEPMWGIEDERPLVLGHFGDSMVPLHGYRLLVDLRSRNELWVGGKNEMREEGLYCGPGLWYDRTSGRVHIRLAHHSLAGLGELGYRGPTDPRELPLVVALGYGEEVIRVTGIRHVRIADLVFRGATGSPMILVYGSENVEFDHVTIYGGFPALLVNASKGIRVTHSAFRGLAAPWTSRAHMKYRGTPSYQIVFQNNQPMNENIELAWSEFTDDHDFAFLRYAKDLRFHHNFVDNFNDDGLECGPKLRDHTLYIYQNRIGRCLIPITQHESHKDESPLDHDSSAGVFLYRNVIDLRGGTYKGPPQQPDPSRAWLHEEGHLASDHGGPIWPVIRFYHNTVLRQTPVFRNYFLFGLGAQGLRQNERDVFNNVFVQGEGVPGGPSSHMKEAPYLREGGNLLWGIKEGPSLAADVFAKFRASPLFAASRARYEPGWTTQDRVADPRFISLPADHRAPADLRLQAGSPAIDSGVVLPSHWPDPLRGTDRGPPDIGAFPLGAELWGIGVDGKLSLFGNQP